MDNETLKSINLTALKEKSSIFVSTKEALKDIGKVKWSEDVVNGNKKVEVVRK